MTLDQFWTIVEKIHHVSRGDMDRKCELLDKELRSLSVDEVVSFQRHFDECADRAYTWDLWAAAYIIGGGCSDDSFSDFRSTLISMGRQTFERAVADPESLAEMDYDADIAQYEGYQYVATAVVSDLGGGKTFPRAKPHPAEPFGETWEEDDVAKVCPKLAKRYDYAG